jgi:ATP-dependent exoDNAse (exonuclease V) beta subunit
MVVLMARRAARIDATAPALVKLAKSLGADYLPLNGIVDGILWHRGAYRLVDWKSKGGTLTDAQARLVARGWRIDFVSTEAQLKALLIGEL